MPTEKYQDLDELARIRTLPNAWHPEDRYKANVEFPRSLTGIVHGQELTVVIDRKARANLIGRKLLKPNDHTPIVSDVYIEVHLPWRGSGKYPYTYKRTVSLPIEIPGLGSFKTSFGICDALDKGLVLGQPFLLEYNIGCYKI